MAAERSTRADAAVAQNGARSSKSTLGWIGGLFTRPLKVKRVGRQLHVVLDEASSSTPSTASRTGGRGEALRLAHVALQDLLARHEDSRRLVPHLSHLEQTLARQGSRALKMLPLHVLEKAIDQLDVLEGGAKDHDLMTLRLRVAEAVKLRTPAKLRDDVSSIEVTEASHSQFDEADRRWTAAAPLEELPLPAK